MQVCWSPSLQSMYMCCSWQSTNQPSSQPLPTSWLDQRHCGHEAKLIDAFNAQVDQIRHDSTTKPCNKGDTPACSSPEFFMSAPVLQAPVWLVVVLHLGGGGVCVHQLLYQVVVVVCLMKNRACVEQLMALMRRRPGTCWCCAVVWAAVLSSFYTGGVRKDWLPLPTRDFNVLRMCVF